jgi:hypothetical protein
MKPKRIKNLYRCMFNYSRELQILYRYAYTDRQAWLQCCRYLADKHGVHPSHVMALFNGDKNNFKFEIVMEMKEVEE